MKSTDRLKAAIRFSANIFMLAMECFKNRDTLAAPRRWFRRGWLRLVTDISEYPDQVRLKLTSVG